MRDVQLGELARKTKTLNPKNFPSEIFDLLSIPAFDRGAPDVASGDEIGSAKQLVSPGDVLIAKIVPHIRRVWVVPEMASRRQIASGEWIVFRSPFVDPSWLRQLLLSEAFHQKFMRTVAGVGGSLLRARPADVFRIPIGVPALDEQRRIADILDKADALRAKRREAIAHLDSLGQSIFHDMFGDPISNPKRWPVFSLGQLGRWQSGGTPLRSKSSYFGSGYWWYTSGELNSKWLQSTSEEITDKAIRESGAKVIPPGALLLGMYDTAALKSGITTQIATCNQAIAFGVLDKSRVSVDYVYEAVQFGRERYRAQQRGVRQKNLNLSMIRELKIPVPPVSLQDQFDKRMTRIGELIGEHQRELLLLDGLFLSLQDRAFKGEL